jgi:hypothetical protein
MDTFIEELFNRIACDETTTICKGKKAVKQLDTALSQGGKKSKKSKTKKTKTKKSKKSKTKKSNTKKSNTKKSKTKKSKTKSRRK